MSATTSKHARAAIAVALLAIALLVFGILLPTGVLSDRFVFDEGDAWNIVALIAGLIGVPALAAIALPKMTAKEAMRIGQFAVGALAGAAGFFRIAGILNESADFTFTDLGAGLVVAPLAAVLIFGGWTVGLQYGIPYLAAELHMNFGE